MFTFWLLWAYLKMESKADYAIDKHNDLVIEHNELLDKHRNLVNRVRSENSFNGVLKELNSLSDYVFIEVLRSEDSDKDKMGMLQTALEEALEEEDYERAAEIRDAIEEVKKEDGGQPPKKK